MPPSQPVSGDGSNDNPYTADCDPATVGDCRVSSFPARSLSGFWRNEYVPAYACPLAHPFLRTVDYAPVGTQLPDGVQVAGLGPIGVSISGVIEDPNGRAYGTLTGFPNSSATNWDGGTNSYQVILHCGVR
jgi:hypothetical protein